MEKSADNVLREIDEIHQISNEALKDKRFEAYLNVFTDNLIYKQLNGKSIGKMQLRKDTAFYFSRLVRHNTSYVRNDFSIEGIKFTENLTQKATASIRVFYFFTKNWTIEREGIYHWINIENNWKIEKVEVLRERIH